MGTDGQRIILTLSALKRGSVYRSLEINNSLVSVFHSSVLYGDQSGVLLLNLLKLCLDVLVSHFSGCLLYFDSFVFAECYLRLNSYSRCVDKFFSLLNLYNVDFRSGYNLQSALGNGIAVSSVERLIDGILI